MKLPRIAGYRGVSEALKKITDPLIGKQDRLLTVLKLHWHEIIDVDSATKTRPFSIKKQMGETYVLTLQVDSGYALIMQHMQNELLAWVNQFLGYSAITSIQLQQVTDGVFMKNTTISKSYQPAKTAVMPPVLETLEDEELKKALQKLNVALHNRDRLG